MNYFYLLGGCPLPSFLFVIRTFTDSNTVCRFTKMFSLTNQDILLAYELHIGQLNISKILAMEEIIH